VSEILKGNLETLGISGSIIIKWQLKKHGRVWRGLMCLRTVTSGFCECGTKPSGSIKGMKFLEQLNDHQLLKKDFAAWSY
jgi:hypothetical protein